MAPSGQLPPPPADDAEGHSPPSPNTLARAPIPLPLSGDSTTKTEPDLQARGVPSGARPLPFLSQLNRRDTTTAEERGSSGGGATGSPVSTTSGAHRTENAAMPETMPTIAVFGGSPYVPYGADRGEGKPPFSPIAFGGHGRGRGETVDHRGGFPFTPPRIGGRATTPARAFELSNALLIAQRRGLGKDSTAPQMALNVRDYVLSIANMPFRRGEMINAVRAFEAYLDEKEYKLQETDKEMGMAIAEDLAHSITACSQYDDQRAHQTPPSSPLRTATPQASPTPYLLSPASTADWGNHSFMEQQDMAELLEDINPDLLGYFKELSTWIKQAKGKQDTIRRVQLAQLRLGEELTEVLIEFRDKAIASQRAIQESEARRATESAAQAKVQTAARQRAAIQQACTFSETTSDLFDITTLDLSALTTPAKSQFQRALKFTKPGSTNQASTQETIERLEALRDRVAAQARVLKERNLSEDLGEALTTFLNDAEELKGYINAVKRCTYFKDKDLDVIMNRMT